MAVAVGVAAAPLELRRVTKERDQDHARDGHVVLERVEEEEDAAQKSEEREAKARRERLARGEEEPPERGEDDHKEHRAGGDAAQKAPGPDDLPAAAAVPDPLEGVLDVVGGRGDARQAKLGL